MKTIFDCLLLFTSGGVGFLIRNRQSWFIQVQNRKVLSGTSFRPCARKRGLTKFKFIIIDNYVNRISFIYRRPTLYPVEIAVDFLKSL